MPSVAVITATFPVVMAAVSIPSHRREDMRELLRKEITRDRKRTVRLPNVFHRAPKDGMRTDNAARGDESSLKS